MKMDKAEMKCRLEAAEKQVSELQNEIEYLKVKLAEAQDEIPDVPMFHRDEPYWALAGDMSIYGGEASGANDDPDFNIFHTSKYARIFSMECCEIAMLLHCKWYIDRDYDPNWCDHAEEKYTVYFDYDDNRWDTSMDQCGEYGNVYFETDEKAKKAAEWMNKHSNRRGSVLL